MRIAVSSEDNSGLDSTVSAHFGRCPFYILVDVEDGRVLETQAVANPYYDSHVPGAVPQFIREQGADVMIAGGMGARAVQLFQQFGVEAVTGAQGTVRQALEGYLDGSLGGSTPCVRHGQA